MEKFTHGLIVVDEDQKGEDVDILHFIGYWKEPTQRDADLLREELKNDPEFGLQEIWEKVLILPAPENILKEYLKIVFENEIENE